jgi:hypothetical protein
MVGLLLAFMLLWLQEPAVRQAVVETSLGTFIIDLAPASAPDQVAHFTKLAEEGAYDGTAFHARQR